MQSPWRFTASNSWWITTSLDFWVMFVKPFLKVNSIQRVLLFSLTFLFFSFQCRIETRTSTFICIYLKVHDIVGTPHANVTQLCIKSCHVMCALRLQLKRALEECACWGELTLTPELTSTLSGECHAEEPWTLAAKRLWPGTTSTSHGLVSVFVIDLGSNLLIWFRKTSQMLNLD